MRDDPIAGAARAVYLDGDAWSATGLVRTFPAGLTCFNNTLKWLPTPSDLRLRFPRGHRLSPGRGGGEDGRGVCTHRAAVLRALRRRPALRRCGTRVQSTTGPRRRRGVCVRRKCGDADAQSGEGKPHGGAAGGAIRVTAGVHQRHRARGSGDGPAAGRAGCRPAVWHQLHWNGPIWNFRKLHHGV